MLDISNVRTLQGANSTTFCRPPFDETLTIPETFVYHAKNSPNHPLFVYPNDQSGTTTVYYPEVLRGIRKAARLASGHYKRLEGPYAQQATQPGFDAPVVGILAVSDTITFWSLIVGIMHLGLIPFPLSPRNSATGVAHLVKQVGVLQLFVSDDAATHRLAQHASELLAQEGSSLDIISMPHFGDLYNDKDESEDAKLFKRGYNDVALIMHSSGSTAFPKPIKVTHRSSFEAGQSTYFGEVDICGLVAALHAVPMFHTMGTANIGWTICTGLVVGCFKPASPPVVPTPEVFWDAIFATGSDIVITVPTFIETWSQSPENISKLRSLKMVAFGGGPLSTSVGDKLFKAGVPLASVYGTTEFMVMTTFLPDVNKNPVWDYVQISGHADVVMLPQEDADDLFEPVVLCGPNLTPNVVNTTINGRPGYATSDLFQSHPTLPGYYRVYGRVDDQIMLSTGEKTNPTPLEAIFVTDPHIGRVLMFGRGRFQNGVLIQPKEPFDPNDEEKLTNFRHKIWPTVEKVNDFAPSHSRVFKEMIIVTNPSKPFEVTAKGTPRRQVCLKAYEAEIDALYQTVKDSSEVEVPIPVSWTSESTLDFTRGLVTRVMQMSLSDEDDLFQQGCDSLQATYIRNTIIHALRTSSTASIHDVPHNLVYMHPHISSLSSFVYSLIATGTKGGSGVSPVEAKSQEMHAMIKKYTDSFHFAKRFNGGSHGSTADLQVVLVTGTTGRLGCHLLEQLLKRSDVHRVYALNRDSQNSDAALKVRQQQAFATWELDVGLLDSKKLVLLASELPKEYLGVGKERYDEIRKSVTAIIHNAWRVDFNLSLSSFEPLIVGVRNLVNLSAESPLPAGPRILFVSSIGTIHSPAVVPVPEEQILDPIVPMGAGYGESKWVSERLLNHTTRESGLRTTTVRVGQLSGDTHIGGWNTKEWVGALVSAAQSLGCMPSQEELVAWVPVDIAAATLLDMVSSETVEPVLHLVHPRPVPWNTLFAPAAAQLNIPLVPYAQWLAKLEEAAAAAKSGKTTREVHQHDTAVTLLEFFRVGEFERIRLCTDRAVRTSVTIAQFPPLEKQDLLKSLHYWDKAGILKL